MKEIDRIANRVKALQGKMAYGMLAILLPKRSECEGFELRCNIIKNGKFVEYEGGVFPSRKHARDYVNSLMQEYNISEDDVKFLNIVGTREGLNDTD